FITIDCCVDQSYLVASYNYSQPSLWHQTPSWVQTSRFTDRAPIKCGPKTKASKSATAVMTMGMVDVASLAASAPDEPWVTSTSTLSRTRSAAKAGSRL